jgi:hypothetical protein
VAKVTLSLPGAHPHGYRCCRAARSSVARRGARASADRTVGCYGGEVTASEPSTRTPRYGAAALYNIATIITPSGLNIEQVLAWPSKTTYLRLALSDLPAQLAAAQAASAGPGEEHPESDLRMFNAAPTLRLAMALELTAHIVYSLTEVAANVACKATAKRGDGLPASFNAIRKAVDKGAAPVALVEALGDVSWYKKVREMRRSGRITQRPSSLPGNRKQNFESMPSARRVNERT